MDKQFRKAQTNVEMFEITKSNIYNAKSSVQALKTYRTDKW